MAESENNTPNSIYSILRCSNSRTALRRVRSWLNRRIAKYEIRHTILPILQVIHDSLIFPLYDFSDCIHAAMSQNKICLCIPRSFSVCRIMTIIHVTENTSFLNPRASNEQTSALLIIYRNTRLTLLHFISLLRFVIFESETAFVK